MSSAPSFEAAPELPVAPVGDFGAIRKDVAHRLFLDPSYTVFDAMGEMSVAAENFVTELATHHSKNALWVGGSLGRREMLPNSDIDLFVVYDNKDYALNDIRVEGVDKFEIGHIDKEKLGYLLQDSFVDANRFIDGRKIGNVPATDVEQMVIDINTPDRQLANIISEYFYYRYFDFPQKTTPMGPNLKYSTGSSRDTIFFNMIARMTTGQFPAIRDTQPELPEVMRHASEHYGLPAPVEAVNLMFTAKNAAISLFDATNDPSNKYVSYKSVASIYDFCRVKFTALGYRNSSDFVGGYMNARREIELTVDTLFTKSLEEHLASPQLTAILSLDNEYLPAACIKEINDHSSAHPQSLVALSAWMTMRSRASQEDMHAIAENMMSQPINRVWGGLMAVACSIDTADQTLSRLADWLYVNEKGAYLTKLITRNPSSSESTKSKALKYYKDKEIII